MQRNLRQSIKSNQIISATTHYFKVCSRRKLQHASITIPTHSIKRVEMSKSYE